MAFVLALPLPAQGLYLNANKPGDSNCPKMEIDIDPTVGRREIGPANSGVVRQYQELHQSFKVDQRKDVSAFTAYDAKKKGTSVGALKGKIVIVALWSYNCDPSARMLMELAQLYPRREKFGFDILAVNFDANRITEDSRALGGWAAIENFKIRNKEFLEQNPIPFYVPGIGKEGASNFINVVNSVPLLAVIDRNGKLASLDMGYTPKLVAMRLSQLIREEHPAQAPAK
ncbi:MAG: redoxin domain-containing protein [Acidobacteria bacterium]|nr:redoxin domain-containing protein [Acidobacteriota bacterium]